VNKAISRFVVARFDGRHGGVMTPAGWQVLCAHGFLSFMRPEPA
jgi:hypothetical protein